MPKIINLALDLMGSETGPETAIKAAQKFVQIYSNVNLTLIGTNDVLVKCKNHPRIKKIMAQDIIAQDDNVLMARRKNNSSMHVGLELVQKQEVAGFLSAGNTNVFVSLAYAIIGLKPGIQKPAFMPFIPTVIPKIYFNMLDVGANLEVNAHDLVQFAQMAVKFNQKILKKPNPKVGILNIGTENYKGFSTHREAHQILSDDPNINYVGFVEPKNLLNYVADIIVADGYAGNLVLKSMEGTMLSLVHVLKTQYRKPWNFLGYLFSKNVLKNFKKTFDYKNQSGAIVLGLNGLAVKTHGSSGQLEYASALKIMYETALNYE